MSLKHLFFVFFFFSYFFGSWYFCVFLKLFEHILIIYFWADLKVTKKKDLTDFYFNLGKNVAFGANNEELRKPEKHVESRKAERQPESRELEKLEEKGSIDTSDKGQTSDNSNPSLEASVVEEKHGGEASTLPRSFMASETMPVTNTSVEEKTSGEQPSSEQPKPNHHKRSGDAVAAAKERYLARKRTKE
jgi:coiled-coil domain-containing protein 55